MATFNLASLEEEQTETTVSRPQFKIGDKVKVIRKGTTEEIRWCGWSPVMDNNIGHSGIVTSVGSIPTGSEGNSYVAIDNDSWWYPDAVLEREPKFKEGDMVLITRKYADSWELGATGHWNEYMDQNVGKTGKIAKVMPEGISGYAEPVYKIEVETGGWKHTYAEFLLEEVPVTTDTKFKIGDIVKIHCIGDIGYWSKDMKDMTDGKTGRVRGVSAVSINVSVHTGPAFAYHPSNLKHASKWQKKKYLEESESKK